MTVLDTEPVVDATEPDGYRCAFPRCHDTIGEEPHAPENTCGGGRAGVGCGKTFCDNHLFVPDIHALALDHYMCWSCLLKAQPQVAAIFSEGGRNR